MNSALQVKHPIIFTDLDGTLLDHHTYSHQAADTLLQKLEENTIPVIPITSKTRAELMELRLELNNDHPFITENGSAVFIPDGYFSKQPDNTIKRDGFLIYELSKSRQHWLKILQRLDNFADDYLSFTAAGIEGIQEMTGLNAAQAQLSNLRECSEPLQWQGCDSRKTEFIGTLKKHGANVLEGGRFMHVVGKCDKGMAMRWLARQYQTDWHCDTVTAIAAGDSQNDIAMLENADIAVQVRSPVNAFPSLHRSDSIYKTQNYGPAGWVEGISSVLYGD